MSKEKDIRGPRFLRLEEVLKKNKRSAKEYGDFVRYTRDKYPPTEDMVKNPQKYKKKKKLKSKNEQQIDRLLKDFSERYNP